MLCVIFIPRICHLGCVLISLAVTAHTHFIPIQNSTLLRQCRKYKHLKIVLCNKSQKYLTFLSDTNNQGFVYQAKLTSYLTAGIVSTAIKHQPLPKGPFCKLCNPYHGPYGCNTTIIPSRQGMFREQNMGDSSLLPFLTSTPLTQEPGPRPSVPLVPGSGDKPNESAISGKFQTCHPTLY